MKLTVLGCGDAFGSGGRLQTSFHVARARGDVLIDCGATALIGMARARLDANRVSSMFISHLHGDHFAGLVWWMLHARFVAKRTAPLTIVGPPGIEARYVMASEALFTRSTTQPRKFELAFVEFAVGGAIEADGVSCTALEVRHPSGAPSCALRLTLEGKTIGFSGDTEWVDVLVEIARGADLFITECYSHSDKVPYHTSWAEIAANLDRLTARRIMLSHMNTEMLTRRGSITDARVLIAEDGMALDL